MSFKVVINGPVASAGSILNRSSKRGMNVPKTEAKIITENKEIKKATKEIVPIIPTSASAWGQN